MKEDNRLRRVSFAEESIKNAFDTLKTGKFEDKKLYELINRAIDDLKENPLVGIKIPKRLWPKEYVKKYAINNLWKYDLPNAWRLIYTIKGDAVQIVSVVLEWMSHKEYDRKFKYKTS